MAYNLALAERLRKLLEGRNDIVEKKMFGGVAFLLNGNMCVGVTKDELIVRLSVELADKALSRPGAQPFQVSANAKPMAGWLLVSADAVSGAANLKKWVDQCVEHASTLPAK